MSGRRQKLPWRMASLTVFTIGWSYIRLSRETREPFAGDEFEGLTRGDLFGLPLRAGVDAVGDQLAGVIAPLARHLQ